MSDTLSIALVGLGGYAQCYANELFDNAANNNAQFTAVIDPLAKKSDLYSRVIDANIPIFDSLEEFYQTQSADLVCIASPITFHREQAILAVQNGSSVLCEKPAAATLEDAQAMYDAQNETGKFIAIGYQLSYHSVTHKLKADINSGKFGQVNSMTVLTHWPRTHSYYNRASWAGAKYSNGQAVFDSPLNNATAHYLHNAFYLLGDTAHSSAKPKSLIAETYRANNIENFDTVAVHAKTESNVDLHFYASHATDSQIGPIMTMNCEDSRIVSTPSSYNSSYIAYMNNGEEHHYQLDPDESYMKKIWDCVDAIRTGARPLCDIEAALSHSMAVSAAQRSCEIVDFPEELVEHIPKENDDILTAVPTLGELLVQCAAAGKLPADFDIEWAAKSKTITF
ncbi:MAG: Gfo/Idh/MocA family oxidoreductase [Lentisphaeria bacterium]|nr:Gfo/Idh/MocA family oxidoreductase [Lentisphaeria bacterium]NQZ67168.1 Gfo/Idh/MocA family oxidoreductase [Lentisphaeria bacterium]